MSSVAAVPGSTAPAVVERIAVSPAEAGQLLGISRAKVFLLISGGELPSFKIGKLRRVRVEDVRAFAASRVATPQAAA
ncbi:MAG: helix-turn-helix domain-containing protein [Xanthomonadaceae bacterium]|jgi:excisionase family DNA binding protein|nr:helix-turn-helix domain-containing protein [Xanthomonadaceae bacterium]